MFTNIKEDDTVLSHFRIDGAQLTPLNCWLPLKVTSTTKAQFTVGKSKYWKKNGNLVGADTGRRLGSSPKSNVIPYSEGEDETDIARVACMAYVASFEIEVISKRMRPAIIRHSDYLKHSLVDSKPIIEEIQAKIEELGALVEKLNRTK